MNWKRRLLMVATAAMVTTALVAGPVSASPMPPHFGSAVKCKYAVTATEGDTWTEARLRILAVIPPVMFANQPGNQVGWRFLVTRTTNGRQLTQIYKSPVQKRVPIGTDSAQFDVMRFKVRAADSNVAVRFRVTLVMFHYNADGSIASRETYELPYYITSIGGIRTVLDLDYCAGMLEQSA